MFGFGGSKTTSNAQSSSYGYDWNIGQSSSFDLGQQQSSSFSDQLASSLSTSQGTSTQRIANEQILNELYGSATGAASRLAGMAPLLQGQAADLYGAGAGFLDLLGVGAGEDYLQARLTDTSARDAQLGALQTGLGNLFRDEINPELTANAVGTGTLGGRRQGVAQGLAVDRLGQQYAAGAAQILGQDQAQRDAAAASLMGGRTQAAATGLGALPGLQGITAAGLGSELDAYSALAAIIGGPTVLTDAQNTSEATSESVARAISEALGFNIGSSSSFSAGFGEDASQSTSSSKGKSFSFGFGS